VVVVVVVACSSRARRGGPLPMVRAWGGGVAVNGRVLTWPPAPPCPTGGVRQELHNTFKDGHDADIQVCDSE
jgi:hypothetical protein